MAMLDAETIGTNRRQVFQKIMQLSLIFLLVFSLSCLISFAGGRRRTARLHSQETGTSDVSDVSESGEDASDGTTKPVFDPEKVIYLTFDDGPGEYTERLLDLLKKYDAKATFFTTSAYPAYADSIKREAQEGHSVGVHTYSHKYKKIYASSTAFWNDFEAQQKVIEEQTGERTTLFRFPGGSSNTVSAFTPGIMTTLAQQANAKGLTYFDWNVSSGDAGATTDSAAVLQNCKKGVQSVKNPVILCHDVKAFTVDAMASFLPWAIENGYTFLPLTADSPNAHHRINN